VFKDAQTDPTGNGMGLLVGANTGPVAQPHDPSFLELPKQANQCR